MTEDPDHLLTLDDKVIERLRQDMGEDAGMVIGSYLESIDEYLDEIENSTLRTPGSDLHRWAHTIKSCAASIGALRLAHLAAELEDACRKQSRVDLASQLLDMQSEFQRVQSSLE